MCIYRVVCFPVIVKTYADIYDLNPLSVPR